jgi:hypothetical protein
MNPKYISALVLVAGIVGFVVLVALDKPAAAGMLTLITTLVQTFTTSLSAKPADKPSEPPQVTP